MTASETEREALVQILMGLQTGCDERYARQVLQKHGWNADQAAAALLDVATAEEEKKTGTGSQRQGVLEEWIAPGALNAPNNPMPSHPRPNSVIDLTGDDDEETAKALVASMETQPTFGPSNRIDDTQQWAMVVPSNAPPALSQEDQALSRALEASLTSSLAGVGQEPYEEPSDPVERVRKDGWPTALRSVNSTVYYAPIVLQCLLSMPKVQDRLLHYTVDCSGTDDQHVFAQRLQRLAATMTHTARAYVAVDEILDVLMPPTPLSNQDPLAGLTLQYYSTLAHPLQTMPHKQDDPASEMPLMYFHGVSIDASVDESSSSYLEGTYVDVIVPSTSGNDLVSGVAHTFTKGDVCLTQLSECLAFVVRRQDVVSSAGTEKAPFKYPSRIFLDRFMQENIERGTELRNCQDGIQHEIQKLLTDRLKLSSWKNQDTLKDLRSSVQYFEKVASDGGDPKRKEAHERSKLKLLEIIKQIEANIQHLDTRIKELTADAEGLFDKPDLQKHAYDLRAVIIHDGLFGRNHVYSYTKDEKGDWWKIVDYQVSKVTEDTVLNDSTGHHLGAGPLLLFYSHASPIDPTLEDQRDPRWPRIVRDLVRQDNDVFLGELPPEVASLVANNPDVLQGGGSDDLTEVPGLPDAAPRRESIDQERKIEIESIP